MCACVCMCAGVCTCVYAHMCACVCNEAHWVYAITSQVTRWVLLSRVPSGTIFPGPVQRCLHTASWGCSNGWVDLTVALWERLRSLWQESLRTAVERLWRG